MYVGLFGNLVISNQHFKLPSLHNEAAITYLERYFKSKDFFMHLILKVKPIFKANKSV